MRKRLDTVPGARFDRRRQAGQKLAIILASRTRRRSPAPRMPSSTICAGCRTWRRRLDREPRAPEITVRPDLAARPSAASPQAIGDTVRIATSGDFAQSLAKLNLDNRQIDIRVKVPEQVRTDMQSIADLRIPGRNGLVPLSSVATSRSRRPVADRPLCPRAADHDQRGLGGYRWQRDRRGEEAAGRGCAAVERALDRLRRRRVHGGAVRRFGLAMLTGVLCVYCVLVLLFRDCSSPSRSSRPCRCPSAARSSRCCSLAASSDCLR